MLGKRCYLIENKRYKNSDHSFYLEGIGTVFIEPYFPKNVILENKFFGYVDNRVVTGCRSYFYGNYYFVFPNLRIDTVNTVGEYTPFNQIKIDNYDIYKLSRRLLDEKQIANTLVNKNTIQIDNIHSLDVAKRFIENVLNEGERFSFFGFIKSKPKRKVRGRDRTVQVENEFPEADFKID